MTMQVLVLAAQNAVPYEQLGVATSGSTLFRQVGGSIGVSVFGAIFANQLASNLADALPPGTQLPDAVSPAVIAQLPAAVHALYLDAFVTALGPVFSVAAAVSLRRLRAHLAAAGGAAPQERGGRGHRRELRDATRRGVAAGAGADPGDTGAAREPLARLRGASPSTPASISTRPSCGSSGGWARKPRST